MSLRRTRVARNTPLPDADPYTALVGRVSENERNSLIDPEQAWLARQLDIAVRGRMTVNVTVTLRDGSTVDYLLEPVHLAGGRLRAKDRQSDIERTLPLASIVAVSTAT